MTENQGISDSVNFNSMIVSLEYTLHQIVSLSNFGKWKRLSITAPQNIIIKLREEELEKVTYKTYLTLRNMKNKLHI